MCFTRDVEVSSIERSLPVIMAPSSPAWAFFKKRKEGRSTIADCKKCSTSYTNPATSTLYYHLEKSHHVHLRKLPPKGSGRKEPETENTESAEEDDVQVQVSVSLGSSLG